MSSILEDIYQRLFDAYGPQYWWPGDTSWEVACGAVLTQNATWKNAEKAIGMLKGVEAMSALAIIQLPTSEVASLIRSAGYFNIKTERLKNLADWWITNKAPDGVSTVPYLDLRNDLLAVKGIGPETADSILLYALGRTTFVVDTYTRRVFSRHGLVDEHATYDEIKNTFEKELTLGRRLFNEYHALIVRLGKDYCKTNPLCGQCVLRDFHYSQTSKCSCCHRALLKEGAVSPCKTCCAE